METCILGQWFKAPGEEVKAGDLLFSYETDKASFEEEAAVDGILLARYYEEGDEVPVLSEIALIGEKGRFSRKGPSPERGPRRLPQKKNRPGSLSFLWIRKHVCRGVFPHRHWPAIWQRSWGLTFMP